uniref:Uncharacterized protein n=1 Tax=Solanum lycopersicum TaxID=4081 RepID=A0A3Q7HS59_SOLLC
MKLAVVFLRPDVKATNTNQLYCLHVNLRDDTEDTDRRLEESNGVDSDAGGSPVLVLASRLQTGQKVEQASKGSAIYNLPHFPEPFGEGAEIISKVELVH